MNCPRCGSEDWKSVHLLHAEGITATATTTTGRTKGGGIAYAFGRFIPGLMRTRTNTRTAEAQQSGLSNLYAPPVVRHRKWDVIMLWVLALLLVVGIQQHPLQGVVGIAVAGMAVVVSARRAKAAKTTGDDYMDRVACRKCGMQWTLPTTNNARGVI